MAGLPEPPAPGTSALPGGTYDGLFYKPTVLAGVKPGMRCHDEEVFGPVLNIATFKTDDEAVAMANDHRGGLAAAVISRSVGRAMAVAGRLKAGMVADHHSDFGITSYDRCGYSPLAM